MNVFSFIDLLRMIYGINLPDIYKIQKKGLLAVKISQHFALRVDFLDPSVCNHLSKLFRNNSIIPAENLDILINSYVSQDWLNNFAEFDKIPFASASIGQVHNAKNRDGKDVVVKIIKKNYNEDFLKDINRLEIFLKIILFFYPKLNKVFDPLGVLNYIKDYTLEELDLSNEIKGGHTLQDIFEKNKDKYDFGKFKFASFFSDISNKNILVSEKIEGKTFDELLTTNELGYDTLLNLFKIHGFYLFATGTFHGDIHPGNIILDEEGYIYFIDTGAISIVGDRLRLGLFHFFEALCMYDYELCCSRLMEMSLKALPDNKIRNFKKDFYSLYHDFRGKTVSEISLTKKMMQTIKLAVNNGMVFEKGMFGIIKSLMYLDGMVIRCNSKALLIEDMKGSIKNFSEFLSSQRNSLY
jgi:ubiquinone biosynthesis protein